MVKPFFRLTTGKPTRVFAIVGIVLAIWLMASFPVIGVGSFAKRIVLRDGENGFIADYPRFLAVTAVVDTSGSVAYHRGDEKGSVSLWIYVGDLDASDVQIRGTLARPNIFLIADCGRVSNETIHRARVILQNKPIDETAFRKLPLTSAQRAVLKLQWLGTPVRIVGIPAGYEARQGVVQIRLRVLSASSYESAP
ncbi:MAG: hypothetical protein Q7S36_02560 [Candidatus Liptonbacteria bacterium]|nr:hypothetical protein [Candidatus Liptonbacteria bacterium]